MSSPQNRFLFYLFAGLEKLIGKKEVFVRRQKVFHECDTTVNVCLSLFFFSIQLLICLIMENKMVFLLIFL